MSDQIIQNVPGGASALLSTSIVLTSTQVTALSSASGTIILPAPGNGKMYVIRGTFVNFTYGGTNAFGGGSLIQINIGTTGLSSPSAIMSSVSGDTTSQFENTATIMPTAALGSVSSYQNQPVTLFMSTASYTGGANNTVRVKVFYTIESVA